MTDKDKDLSVWYLVIITFSVLGLFNVVERIYHHLHLKPDNEIEQAIEQAIEHHTGLEIDLTPSPSKVAPEEHQPS